MPDLRHRQDDSLSVRDTTLTAAETERRTRRGLRLAQFTFGYTGH